jgi:hypothetical protein
MSKRVKEGKQYAERVLGSKAEEIKFRWGSPINKRDLVLPEQLGI